MNGDPFMTKEDLIKAEQSRKRQVVVYPDGMEETDDSKQQRRSLLAEQRNTGKVSSPKQKFLPTYNPITHRFTFY